MSWPNGAARYKHYAISATFGGKPNKGTPADRRLKENQMPKAPPQPPKPAQSPKPKGK